MSVGWGHQREAEGKTTILTSLPSGSEVVGSERAIGVRLRLYSGRLGPDVVEEHVVRGHVREALRVGLGGGSHQEHRIDVSIARWAGRALQLTLMVRRCRYLSVAYVALPWHGGTVDVTEVLPLWLSWLPMLPL